MRSSRILPLIAAILIAAGAVPSHALFGFGEKSAAPEPVGAVLSSVLGKVEHMAKDADKWKPASSQQLVQLGDQIKTGPKGKAFVVFLDGTKLLISEKSEFTFKSHSPKKVSVYMGVGILEAWVKKVAKRRFEVRTPSAVASVRGTEWRTEVAPTGDTNFDLFGGSLDVNDNFGNFQPIDPGQRIVADDAKGIAESKPEPIPQAVVMAPEPAVNAAAAKEQAAQVQVKAEQAAKKAETAKQELKQARIAAVQAKAEIKAVQAEAKAAEKAAAKEATPEATAKAEELKALVEQKVQAQAEAIEAVQAVEQQVEQAQVEAEAAQTLVEMAQDVLAIVVAAEEAAPVLPPPPTTPGVLPPPPTTTTVPTATEPTVTEPTTTEPAEEIILEPVTEPTTELPPPNPVTEVEVLEEVSPSTP
ncbi:MAG: FecR domain-containing protein [Elusimicrobiota bacterium]